jgi:hypothetical protein
MHVQMMSVRIDRITNRATQDNANAKAAVWLMLMMVSDAMRPSMGRRPVVLFPMLMQAMLLSTWTSSVVSQRWS